MEDNNDVLEEIKGNVDIDRKSVTLTLSRVLHEELMLLDEAERIGILDVFVRVHNSISYVLMGKGGAKLCIDKGCPFGVYNSHAHHFRILV